MNGDSFNEARTLSLNYLSYRPRSTGEVVQNLRKREFSEDVITDVVSYLEKCRYLDDENFARRWIESHIGNVGGVRKIKKDLQAKGVDKELIDALLVEYTPSINSREYAESLLRKQLWRYKSVSLIKAKSRMLGFLARRGYEASFSYEVIDTVSKELEQDEVKRS